MKKTFSWSARIITLLALPLAAYAEVHVLNNATANTLTAQSVVIPTGISISVVPKNNSITMGEPLICTVVIEKNMGMGIKGFQYPQPWGDWVLLEHQDGSFSKDTKTGKELRKDELKITSMLDGNIEIPALSVTALFPDGKVVEFKSQATTVMVKPKLNKKGEMDAGVYDIKKPLWLASFWNIFLALLIGALVLFALWWYSKKRGILGYSEQVMPKRPPEEIALEALEDLKKSNFLSEGAFKQYYVVLIDILRRYLNGCFNIAATDRTTPELIKELKPLLNRKDISTIRDLLERGDMIKFAKASPDIKEIDQDWSNIKVFIEETSQAIKDAQVVSTNPGNKPNNIGAK